MAHSLFISDLHLCESRPHITQTFIRFLETTAKEAEALYILGDLFEYWAGDDAIAAGRYRDVINALSRLTNNIPAYLLLGNRDFLLGKGFSDATRVEILADPCLVKLYGKPILLSHGDALCTDDVTYQKFRNEVRTKQWKADFLRQPLRQRIDYIEQLRAKSEQEKSAKSMEIMDVNKVAVEDLLARYHYPPIFIHGHTHRPMQHIHQIAEHICERWVLGDWYDQGSYLTLSDSGCKSHVL